MAITKTIEIDVNTLQAVGGLDNLDKALKQVDKSATNLDATFEEVYGDLKPLTARMGEAEDRLYELALAGQTATQEYKDLLASVGQYRQVQMRTDMAVDVASTKLETRLSVALQGVSSGYLGLQGVMALTGGQSEELEQALLKVQGAMALTQGIEGLRAAVPSFKALGTSAKAALSSIRTGIAATGIGVLLVALGAVVAYWDDIKEAVNGVSSEQEELNSLAQTNLEVEQGKLDAVSSQDNILKLQGKSEKEILQLKLAQTEQVIKASEAQIEQSIATTKAQTEAAKRNQEILAGVLKFLSIPLTMILKTVDAVGSALGKDFGLEEKVFKGISSLVFDPKETQAEGDKVVAEQKKALEKLKNDRAGLQLSIKNIDNQSNKEAADKRKEANDKAIQAEKDKADALERIRQGEIDTEAERRAEEIRQVQEQYRLLIAEATKYGQDTTALKEAQRTKEKELQDKFDTEDAEKKLAADEKKKADDQKKLDEEKRIKDEKIAIAQAEADAKLAIQNAVLDNVSGGIGVLKQLGEKNKAVQKAAIIAENAVGIARIILNTQAANAKSIAASPLTAGQPWVTVNTISGALSVASSLLATKKALSALGGGSAGSAPSVGGGSGGGSGTAPAAPQFNVVGNSGVNQIAQTLGAQQPVQAYVVANNVTTAQSLDRNIIQNASLG